MSDQVEGRRRHLAKQLGEGVASRLSRVDYLRILRAEREGRRVYITESKAGRMRITSSPPEIVAGETVRIPAKTMSLFLGVKLLAARARQKPNPVVLPPGHHSLRVLEFLFSRRTFERVFAQIAADEREEHSDALISGQTRKAKWIAARVNVLLLWSAGMWVVTVVGKQVISMWKLVI